MSSDHGSDLKDFVVHRHDTYAARTRRLVDQILNGLGQDDIDWQAQPGHHSIWHHLWHMFTTHDHFFGGAFGVPTTWEQGGWKSRIDLSRTAKVFTHQGFGWEIIPRWTICDVPDSLVDELKSPPLDQYFAYVDDLFTKQAQAVRSATASDLTRDFVLGGNTRTVGDQVTDFGHVFRHVGMMEDVKGLIKGAGKGTATI
jgi:hypothetical protein